MSDEQLQALFAGMERRIDERMDQLEKHLAERLNVLLTGHTGSLGADIRAMFEHIESTVTAEFRKCTSPVETGSRPRWYWPPPQ